MAWLITWCRFVCAWALTLAVSGFVLAGAMAGLGRFVWLWGPRFWGYWSLWLLGIDHPVIGRRNLVGPALFISSHKSLLDIVVLPALLPRHTLWVAKREIRNVPIWGWALGATGGMFIDRANSAEAKARIRTQVAKLRSRYGLAIFPEGTRSKGGELGPLKKGIFHIALQCRLPIVPISIVGADRLVPLGKWMPRAGIVHIAVGTPICTEKWTHAEIDQRMAELRQAIIDCQATAV